jgi:hypothetical protein
MPRPLLLFAMLIAVLAGASPEAWAQATVELPCPQASEGTDCAEVTRWGAWGLIFLGLMCFVVWLEPPRRSSEGEESALHRIPMLGVLQRRLDKERIGWRRFQWPVLGAFFIALGAATLAGWR